MRKISYLLLLLGLVITQTVKAEKTAKAIWTAGNTTMTFVYDERTYNVGDTYGVETITNVWEGNEVIGDVSGQRKWTNTVSSSLTKVVFDESFKDASPTSCAYWFYNCIKLSNIEGLSNLNTSLVTNMAGMFYGCAALTSLDLSSFDTGNVTNMSGIFRKCTALTDLDLSTFCTSKVTEMSGMFRDCTNLKTITVSNGWNADAVENTGKMFEGCSSLKGGNGTEYDSNNPIKDGTYAHVDKEGTPGYLTLTKDVFILDITSAGMATLYFDGNLAIPDDVDEVSYCSSINNKGEVAAHKLVEAIPASTGVYVKGVAGCYILRKPDASVVVPEITNNIMTGTLEETSPAPRTVLTLGHERSTGELGFHYFTGNKISAFKAYIPVEKISASAPAISFFPIKYFEDEATGISILPEVSKVEDDAIYDLAGRKVKAATKGIFIKNGKKFIVK